VVVVADSSALYAAYVSTEPAHGAVVEFLDRDASPLVVSPQVVNELDHVVLSRWGVSGEIAVIDNLATADLVLPPLDHEGLRRCVDVIAEYQELPIGLADASLVVLAERYETRRILTLDRRHFTVMKPLQGGEFELLP
jgi:predicted nucleic acid-binding protein